MSQKTLSPLARTVLISSIVLSFLFPALTAAYGETQSKTLLDVSLADGVLASCFLLLGFYLSRRKSAQ